MKKEETTQKKSTNCGKNSLNVPDKISWKTIFMAKSGGFSSKRICGIVGFFVCIGIFIAAFIMNREVPTFGDMIIVTSASLIGVDAFRGIFSRQTSV